MKARGDSQSQASAGKSSKRSAQKIDPLAFRIIF
jgi:hypothetical protein